MTTCFRKPVSERIDSDAENLGRLRCVAKSSCIGMARPRAPGDEIVGTQSQAMKRLLPGPLSLHGLVAMRYVAFLYDKSQEEWDKSHEEAVTGPSVIPLAGFHALRGIPAR